MEAGPAKPEDTNRKGDTSNNDGWQTPFRHGNVVIAFKLLDIRWLNDDHENGRANFTDNQTKVWKTANTLVETVDLLENDRIERQQKIEDT